MGFLSCGFLEMITACSYLCLYQCLLLPVPAPTCACTSACSYQCLLLPVPVPVPEAKRRAASYDTYKKWVSELDKSLQTLTWLDCETKSEGGKRVVSKLKCKICEKFVSKICGRKHFSDKWIVGADSVRSSNIKDHAECDQHTEAAKWPAS